MSLHYAHHNATAVEMSAVANGANDTAPAQDTSGNNRAATLGERFVIACPFEATSEKVEDEALAASVAQYLYAFHVRHRSTPASLETVVHQATQRGWLGSHVVPYETLSERQLRLRSNIGQRLSPFMAHGDEPDHRLTRGDCTMVRGTNVWEGSVCSLSQAGHPPRCVFVNDEASNGWMSGLSAKIRCTSGEARIRGLLHRMPAGVPHVAVHTRSGACDMVELMTPKSWIVAIDTEQFRTHVSGLPFSVLAVAKLVGPQDRILLQGFVSTPEISMGVQMTDQDWSDTLRSNLSCGEQTMQQMKKSLLEMLRERNSPQRRASLGNNEVRTNTSDGVDVGRVTVGSVACNRNPVEALASAIDSYKPCAVVCDDDIFEAKMLVESWSGKCYEPILRLCRTKSVDTVLVRRFPVVAKRE